MSVRAVERQDAVRRFALDAELETIVTAERCRSCARVLVPKAVAQTISCGLYQTLAPRYVHRDMGIRDCRSYCPPTLILAAAVVRGFDLAHVRMGRCSQLPIPPACISLMSAVLQEPTPFYARDDGRRPGDRDRHRAQRLPRTPGPRGSCATALRVGYNCWVWYEVGRDIVGHAVMSVAIGEAHLLNICVGPEWQGRGIGRRFSGACCASPGNTMRTRCSSRCARPTKRRARVYESEGLARSAGAAAVIPRRKGRKTRSVCAKALF